MESFFVLFFLSFVFLPTPCINPADVLLIGMNYLISNPGLRTVTDV